MELASGFTLMHEHMSIALSPGDLGTDSFEDLCADLCELKAWGVGNIVDLTNQSMGRDVGYVRKVAEETGINIIMSTGFYLERCLDGSIAELTVSELADAAVHDLVSGIGDSDVKAGVIGEIAWSDPDPGPLELKTWEAMRELSMGYEDCGYLPHAEKCENGSYRNYHRMVMKI
jgi:phosphotriesterase-related protein